MKKLLVFLAFAAGPMIVPALYAQTVPFAADIRVSLDTQSLSASPEILGKRIGTPGLIGKQQGHTERASGGHLYWRLNIEIQNARAVIPYFRRLVLPEGSSIYAYAADRTHETAKSYSNDNIQNGLYVFALPVVKSNRIIIEAEFKSEAAYNDFECEIIEVGALVSNFGDAPSCFPNANCPEGNPWDNQRRATAKYVFTDENGQIGNCTGGLVNNTNQDCKPYFLSAQHCTGPADAALMAQYIFYFNYQSPGCTSPANDNGLDQQTVIGCTLRATSGTGSTGIPTGTDFTLMELNPIPASYYVYFDGWNRNDFSGIPGPGVVFHHSSGDLKKVSFWDAVQVSGTSVVEGVYHCVPSANGEGTATGGSSGSLICDANGQVTGVLNNGSGMCTSQTSDPMVQGGIMYHHWTSNGSTPDRQLAPWLDPANTGAMTFAGKDQCNTGINDQQNPGAAIAVYPNPTDGKVFIDINLANEEEGELAVFDMLGNKVYSKSFGGTRVQNLELDLSAYAKGLYFVTLNTASQAVTQKLLVQ